MSILDLEITETSLPNLNDLKVWYEDYYEVKEQIEECLKDVSTMTATEQLEHLLEKIHHNNAFDICSDTSEPLEYIDFNYGSITCTISIWDRAKPELVTSFDGWIKRNGEELSDCYMEVDIEEVETVLGNGK